MRVLITGGAGFIGSHIADQLLEVGHEPFVVDNLSTGDPANLADRVRLFEVDICDEARLAEVFDEVRPEAVCHQAAQMSVSRSVREPVYDAEVNILGWLQVLEQASRTQVSRVVLASSGGVLYGDVSEPADEDHPAAPISPYGISKWADELYLEFYCRREGFRGVALRYANVYGPRQNPHGEAGVVAIFCRNMLAGRGTTINGDGKYLRDYVYVHDVARANLLALTTELPSGMSPINIGTSQGTDVNELAAMLHELCAASAPQVTVPTPTHGPARDGDLRSSLVAVGRADELLGWEPSVTVAGGLKQTVGWFAEHRETQVEQ